MFASQLYLLYLIGVMIIAGVIKEHGLFSGFLSWTKGKIKSNRIMLAIVSLFSGVLPVPGRIVVSAPVFSSFAKGSKKAKSKIGLLNYLATHHWYFWSPLEKTVILPMAAFALSYGQMISYTWPLLAFFVAVTALFLWLGFRDSDIEIAIPEGSKTRFWRDVAPLLAGIGALVAGVGPHIIFGVLPLYYICVTKTFSLRKILNYVNWRLIFTLAVVLFLSFYISGYSGQLKTWVRDNGASLPVACALGFVAAFVMGSSSKYAALVVLLSSVFGLKYMTLFIAVEYAAYLLSPTHKCVPITKEYFGISALYLWGWLSLVALGVIGVGILTIL